MWLVAPEVAAKYLRNVGHTCYIIGSLAPDCFHAPRSYLHCSYSINFENTQPKKFCTFEDLVETLRSDVILQLTSRVNASLASLAADLDATHKIAGLRDDLQGLREKLQGQEESLEEMKLVSMGYVEIGGGMYYFSSREVNW